MKKISLWSSESAFSSASWWLSCSSWRFCRRRANRIRTKHWVFRRPNHDNYNSYFQRGFDIIQVSRNSKNLLNANYQFHLLLMSHYFRRNNTLLIVSQWPGGTWVPLWVYWRAPVKVCFYFFCYFYFLIFFFAIIQIHILFSFFRNFPFIFRFFFRIYLLTLSTRYKQVQNTKREISSCRRIK